MQNLCINPGAKVTASSGTSLNVDNLFIIKSNATGNGSLICNGKCYGTVVKVEQYLTGDRNTYIASPLSAATSSVIKTPVTNKLWFYNEPTATWNEITNTTTPLEVLKGYVTLVPHDTVITFTGNNSNNYLNAYNKVIDVSRYGTTEKSGFNLIGNPYPSCVNWEMAFKTNVDPTLWYRTKNTNNAYVFDTYNADLKVGTNNNGKGAVTQFIPPMQAVWVRVLPVATIGTLNFNNLMLSHPVTGNSLKSNNDISAIHLQVSNGQNSDETILIFNENASNSLDGFDSHKMFVNNADVPEIYTTASTEKLVINGLKSFESANVIPLGFKTAKAGTFTFSATDISGIAGTVTLEDKLLNKTQDLSQRPTYSFTSDSVDNAGRFALHLKAQETSTESKLEGNGISVFTKDNSVIVQILEVQTGTVTVFDVLGQVVASGALTGTQTVLPLPAVVGAYFVKVETGGRVTSYGVRSYK